MMPDRLRQTIDLILRLLLGFAGGYALAALTAAGLSLAAPLPRSEATVVASLAAFAVWIAAVMAAFARRGGARPSMMSLHTWLGVVAGWLLFAIFLTGTASIFKPEITRWMTWNAGPAPVAEQGIVAAFDHLQRTAPNARTWTIFPPDDRDHSLRVYSEVPGRKPAGKLETLNPSPVATRGGDFFLKFHHDLELPRPWGRWLAGLAAVAMCAGVISGVIIHRRIFKDFFSFRPRLAPLRSWLDAHQALGVFALPFHLMIAFTGLVVLLPTYMPWGIQAAYGADRAAFTREIAGDTGVGTAAGVRLPLASAETVLLRARERWGADSVGRIIVRHPNDAAAVIVVDRKGEVSHWARTLSLDARGEVSREGGPSAAGALYGALYGLHLADFAPVGLRWLYFLSGLMGTGLIASGLVAWTLRRPEARRLARVNAGMVAGLPLAAAAYFWANRLAPATIAERASVEVRTFFLAWVIMLAAAVLLPRRTLWPVLLATVAIAWGGLALADLPGLVRGEPLVLAFDLVFIALAAAFAWAAWKLRAPRIAA